LNRRFVSTPFAALRESAFGRLCCKTILGIRARKIDSRLGASAQG
jgi:hypothetical protein